MIRTRSDGLRFQGRFRLGNSKNIHWDVALGDTVSEQGGGGFGGLRGIFQPEWFSDSMIL